MFEWGVLIYNLPWEQTAVWTMIICSPQDTAKQWTPFALTYSDIGTGAGNGIQMVHFIRRRTAAYSHGLRQNEKKDLPFEIVNSA